MDAAGDLFIADTGNNCIREVNAATGVITTVAGNGTAGYSGDGGLATAAELYYPYGIAVDAAGDLFIADTDQGRIREVNHATHDITTVAGNGTVGYSGDGGQATDAELDYPYGVAMDATGNLFIADTDNIVIREVNASHDIITTVAGNGTEGYSGDGGPATAAELDYPHGVAVDASGDLFIADTYNDRIREVNARHRHHHHRRRQRNRAATAATADRPPPRNWTIPRASRWTPAATCSSPTPTTASSARSTHSTHITTVAGNGICGYGGDGGQATAAELDDPAAWPWTPPATCSSPTPTTTASARSTPPRTITTVAGSGRGSRQRCPATAAELSSPTASRWTPPAICSSPTPATTWSARSTPPRASSPPSPATAPPAIAATADRPPPPNSMSPDGVAVDAAGDLFIADTDNSRIREVNAATHVITTVAGNGYCGYSGDGGPATAAELDYPSGVAVDAAGDLFIADTDNTVIREVNA